MGQPIGGSLPLAVGIAFSRIPIIAVVLMLTSRRANVNGLCSPAAAVNVIGRPAPRTQNWIIVRHEVARCE